MKTKEQLEQALEDAFKRFPVGTPVYYYPIMGEATRRAEWVRGEPWILSGHTVVLKLSNQTGCVDVDHLQVRETDQKDQPESGEAHLVKELQRLGEEYGCPGGMQRIAWLRQRLTKLAVLEAAQNTHEQWTYQYCAEVNTPRGPVCWDGVIQLPCQITGIEHYHEARRLIALDGNIDAAQVNVKTMSWVGKADAAPEFSNRNGSCS